MKLVLKILIIIIFFVQIPEFSFSSDVKLDGKFEMSQEKITFRIQIAASETQLSLKRLRLICPGKMIINNEKDGKWYKYTVGEYNLYKDALAAKKKLGISGSFIVAYKNGIRLTDINSVVPKNEYTE